MKFFGLEANKKTVFVELDIRKPMLGEYIDIDKNKGISLYLSDPTYKIEDIIVPSGLSKSLKVIPAGPVPPNPAELLSRHTLDDAIEAKAAFEKLKRYGVIRFSEFYLFTT